MSVQVKTPTKTRFDCRTEIQCGERSFSSPESFRKAKDDLNIKNEARFSQPWGRKRRYSQTYRRDEGAARRKRLRSSPYIGPLPNRFLNGGSIDDPLNLNGLDSSELGKELNAATPQSSPLPTPTRRQSVEVRIPFNITDPLNLNDSDEEADLEKKLKKKKQRNRHKKRDDQSFFSPPKHINKDQNLMEALKIDVEPEKSLPESSTPKEFTKPRPVCDKIVSPVIRQISPKSKKRRRTNSGSKPEPSSSVSRSLPTSNISPSLKDKKTPPKPNKRFKQPKPPCAKPKGEKTTAKFIYGNYNRYYGYRNPSMDDKRLNCFKKEWFEGKCVLDVGCNVGNLTLSLAKDYHPLKIIGMDIDSKLIALARKNIRLFMSSSVADTGKFPISNVLNYGPIVAPPVSLKEAGKQANFPHNVLFMQGNFVLESDELLDLQKEEYDVILALSVTKWIHFNWGDDGLKRFFKRVYRQLKPGGRFILEPQPWSSYKKKKKLTEEIFKNFQKITLRPDQFTDYLLSKEIGFSTCNTVDVPYNASKGFRRPIIVFTKSDTVQNSPWSEVGSATPLRSSHPAVFGSHLSQISEDSSCSCSSVSHQSISGDSVDEPAPAGVKTHSTEKINSDGNINFKSVFPNVSKEKVDTKELTNRSDEKTSVMEQDNQGNEQYTAKRLVSSPEKGRSDEGPSVPADELVGESVQMDVEDDLSSENKVRENSEPVNKSVVCSSNVLVELPQGKDTDQAEVSSVTEEVVDSSSENKADDGVSTGLMELSQEKETEKTVVSPVMDEAVDSSSKEEDGTSM